MGREGTTRVGIIGDGQLGMMLCQAAPALGLHTVMLAGDGRLPAAQCAQQVIVGAMDDLAAIDALVDASDVITCEREDLPPACIARLRGAARDGALQCHPPLDNIELLQDKARQKLFFADNRLATLPFVLSDGSPGKRREAQDLLGLPLVQKALRGTFDGRGVQVLRDAPALDAAWPGATLLEQHAGDFREIAVLVARGRDGELAHFGPVDMRFETAHAVLDTVTAPSLQPEGIQRAAVSLARAAVTALHGVGVYGVEMFVLAGGEVVINEISPRVHNAGHYSLVACAASQFEQHLRAVAGLPLADTALHSPAAMRNILATPALQNAGVTEPAGCREHDSGAQLCWYGKSPARAMRKLGHITATGDSPAAARERVDAAWEAVQARAESAA